MTCPHCRNTGYDASGYPCTCGIEVLETGHPRDFLRNLQDIVVIVITSTLTAIILVLSVALLTIEIIQK